MLTNVLLAEWTVPETTPSQHALAALLVVLFAGIVLVVRARYRSWGLTDRQKQVRARARAAKRQQTPKTLRLPSAEIRDGDIDLYSRFDSLLDRDTPPSETQTTLAGALATVYRAISVAWADRMQSVPRLARRAGALAVSVAVFGAVAVSTNMVVAVVTHDASTPSLAAVATSLTDAGQATIAVVGLFPYAGTLWQLAFAGGVLAAQLLYQQWLFLAVLLAGSAVGVAALTWRLDSDDVPDRMIHRPRRIAVGVVGVLAVIWTTGTVTAVVGGLLPGGRLVPIVATALLAGVAVWMYRNDWLYQDGERDDRLVFTWVLVAIPVALSVAAGSEWSHALGLLYALEVAGLLCGVFVPRAARSIYDSIETVAGSDAPLAAALLVVQRGAVGLSSIAAALTAVYVVVGVSQGRFQRVLAALASAPPTTQAALAAVAVGLIALVAYLVADAWPDVQLALRAAASQQAIRAQIVGRGIPIAVVAAAYVLAYVVAESIPVALALAIVAGVTAQKLLAVGREVAYRATGGDISDRLVQSSPASITCLGFVLDLDIPVEDAGSTEQTYYLFDVNGETLLSTDRSEAVRAAVEVATASTSCDSVPATDADWYADFLLETGISDPEDWDAKLDAKIRETVFDVLRPGKTLIPFAADSPARVPRDQFEQALDDFDSERVERRLAESDIQSNITRDTEYVALARDPHVRTDSRDWPTFGD